MSGALIEKEDAWLPVQGASQQQALLLSARQGASHIADETIVGHGHGHDLLVDAGKLRTSNHPVLVEIRVEETDIVCDRAGQKLVLLHDRAHLFAIGSPANRR